MTAKVHDLYRQFREAQLDAEFIRKRGGDASDAIARKNAIGKQLIDAVNEDIKSVPVVRDEEIPW